MNWGIKILIAYLLFVTGILVLVFKSVQSRFDLVEPQYYEAELTYQDRIDEAGRHHALKESIKAEIVNGNIRLTFPEELSKDSIEATAVLYYPADAKKDRNYQFMTLRSYELNVPPTNKGWHRLKLRWKAKNQHYYFETGMHL